MATKQKAPDTAAVDAQLMSTEELRRQLEAQRADIEARIAANLGNDTSELELQHHSLTARLSSIPARIRQLTADKEAAERAETLRLFEQYTAEKHAAYSLAYDIDQQIELLHKQINALTKKRLEVLEPVQILRGRLQKLIEPIARLNLGEATNEIRRKFPRVGDYM